MLCNHEYPNLFYFCSLKMRIHVYISWEIMLFLRIEIDPTLNLFFLDIYIYMYIYLQGTISHLYMTPS